MSTSQPKKLSLDEWLSLAQKPNLSEAEHQQLLVSLPNDPAERQNWLNELSVAMALNESAKNNPEWLKNVLGQLQQKSPAGVARKSSRLWPKAIAATIVGGLIFTLVERPKLDRFFDKSAPENSPMTVLSEFSKNDADKSDLKERLQDAPSQPVSPEPFEAQTPSKAEANRVEPCDLLEVKSPEENLAKLELDAPITAKKEMDALVDIAGEAPAIALCEVVEPQNLADSQNFVVRTPSAIAGVRGSEYKEQELPTGYSSRCGKAKSRKLSVDGSVAVQSQSFVPPASPTPTGETYASVAENAFIQTAQDQQSTFSIDVDTASYSNVRRILRSGQLPPPDAVRVEEMINYFDYNYPQAKADEPFSVTMDMGACPWNQEHRLLRVGLKGRVDLERPKVNLVFLLDVSGSMNEPNKLPLLKQSFKLLLKSLNQNDKVGIVAYAGHTGVVLDPTPASQRDKIIDAIDRLVSQGSTNGTGGIQLAYQLAQLSFEKGSVNRVILATDGDFNVGISNNEELQKFIEEKRKTGIELSVLGFGTGNIRDDIMETLANKGNGNYSYIDTLREARKALVGELNSNLVTIAKDVKIQMEFNPAVVQSFRLVGYENRKLAHQDFADDTKDAGEMGMGHTVTALYEMVLRSEAKPDGKVAELRLRYKKPQGEVSQLLTYPVLWNSTKTDNSDFQWAAATASWGQWLKHSSYVKEMSMEKVMQMARQNRGTDANGYRAEMIQLMEQSMDLSNVKDTPTPLPRWENQR